MKILIIRDGGATKIPRTIADAGELKALMDQGYEVEVVLDPADVVSAAEVTAPEETPVPDEDQRPEA